MFAEGILQYAGDIEEVRAYIENSLANDDMADIHRHYIQQPGRNFWVAEIDGAVKGIAALEQCGHKVAEVRRVSVDRHCRRLGIARALMDTLEAYAVEQGLAELILYTANLLQPAVSLYEGLGYHQKGETQYGGLILMQYAKNLVTPPAHPTGWQN